MDVVVPDLGDFSNVEIIEILVIPGDTVEPETPLITLETDKATMEVPSPSAGVVKGLMVAVGDRVSAGDPIVSLETAMDDRGLADTAGASPSEPLDAHPQEERTGRRPRPGAGAPPAPLMVTVPDMGEFSAVEIIEVLVAVGDEIEPEQGLITLETEKATMDVPAPSRGQVLEVKVGVGDRVSAGDEVLVMAPSEGAASGLAPSVTPVKQVRPPSGQPLAPQPSLMARPLVGEAEFSAAHASPSVRRLARELGVALGKVQGSGREGRVTAEDVKGFVKGILRGVPAEGVGPALPAVPDVEFADFGPVEIEPLGRIQKISGPRLHASWVNLPHVTQHDEADITELEEKRQALKEQAELRGIRLTLLAFVLRA